MAQKSGTGPDGSRIVALDVTPPAGTSRPGERFVLGAGEVAVAVQPRLSSRVAADGARRLHAFAGRALTGPLLEAEQAARARRLALTNRALSAGVVDGLALAFDDAAIAPIENAALPAPEGGADLDLPRRLTLEPGVGLAAGGEDVIAPLPQVFDALDLPVVAPPWLLSDADPAPTLPPEVDGHVLLARAAGRSLRELLALGRPVPRVGVVVLEPVEHRVVPGADPFDQCERDLDAEAFEDQLRQDAGRLVYVAWPDEWLALPAPGIAWRNAIAQAIFAREAEQGSSQAMPWHGVGVPVALVAFDAAWRPLFADRGAVVRLGGRPRGEAAGGLAAGTRFLWQARIEQFGEHLAEAAAAGADTAAIGAQMRVLPPAGLLPRDAIDARAGTNRFFPATLDLVALPLPIEQLDHVLEAAAGLAPIDLAVRDGVCVYVPVPQAVWDARLLVTEVPDADGAIAGAIERYVDDRADWLRRRQRQRVQREALQAAADGPANADAVPPPQEDPLRTELERFEMLVPTPAGLLHRSARAAGLHQHYLDRATRTLEVRAGDRLFAWVMLDRAAPPRTLMLQWQVAGSWEHRAFWGDDTIGWGIPGTPSRLQQSSADPPEVPPAGRWLRLELPASAVGLEGTAVGGIAFTLFDGQALFGPAGVLRGDEAIDWTVQETFDSGTLRGDAEAWDFVVGANGDTAFEDSFGTGVRISVTPGQQGVRRFSTELGSLLIDPLVAGRMLAPVTGDDSALGQVEKDDPAERGFRSLPALIEANGLRATVADLAARIDEADDAINLGYLRVQTDLYRLRQSVLKESQASRFAVSPALTQIADLDNASATREQLAGFYDAVKSGTPQQRPADQPRPTYTLRMTKTVTPPTPKAAATRAAPAPRAGGSSLSDFRIASGSGSAFTDRIGFFTPAPPAPAPAPAFTGGAKFELAGTFEKLPPGVFELAPGAFEKAPTPAPPPTTSVTEASALIGKAEIRTSSIASRMERPRAIEAKDFTVATRLEVIGKLAALGLDLDELDVPGLAEPRIVDDKPVTFDPSGQPFRAAPLKLKELRKAFARVSFDPDPDEKARDESAYFLGGVDLSDHTMAVLRAAEGIVRRYRDALQRCQKALAAIDASLGALAQRLVLVERELAESRQDVATARALLAEEIQRAADLNAQRDRVIAEHVRFLAFARPRLGRTGAALPRRDLDNALEPDAVPACLVDHDEPPGDVAAMLAIVRQAPVGWFPAMRGELALLDTPLAADRVLVALPASGAAIAATSVSAVTLAAGLAGGASQKLAFDALRAQADSVVRARSEVLPAAGAALAADLGLVAKIGFIAQGASLADLAAASAGRSRLNRRVAEELERIAAVATCLHARLSTVRAAIRLEWAERFGAFDAAGDLGDLSLLPRFTEIPEDDRDDIRELAAWLRRRVEASNAQAVALMNALLRVCVLAASHSPAGALLTGRLVRPLPVHPGVRFEVQPALPERLRIGMAVRLVDPALDETRIAAHAVVADIVGGVAHVSVTQTLQAGFVPSARASVQFVLR